MREEAEKFRVVNSIKSFGKIKKAENGDLIGLECYMTRLLDVKECSSGAVSFPGTRGSIR